MTFVNVLGAELLKLRRSKVTWISFIFYAFFALMAAFVLWIVKNPDAARSLGLVGQKASFASSGITADWRGLFTFFAEMNIAGGMIVLSLIVIFLFGREYIEGTAKNMLALPIRRFYFVAAKFLVAALWFALLTVFLLAESLLLGRLLALGAVPPGLFAREGGSILLAALLVFALQGLVAWVTVESGGYLAPFGYTIATLFVGNLMIRTDWAAWCPWSIVALLGGLAGPRRESADPVSILILALTFALGFALTLRHEVLADNSQ
jgi:ABC-2 type transport system permease protein